MRVMVIGAGLGGLTLAHGLRRAGVDVVVYERDQATGRPQGVSLHFDDRALTAMRACLPPGHAAMVEATAGGQREHTLSLSEADGELTVSAQPENRARKGRQVHRPLLRAVLSTGMEDHVRFGAEFTRFEQRAGGTVRAWFADGSTDTADVLVGADGIGSAVRSQYLPHVQVIDTGKRMLMGATPLRAVAGTGLPALIGHNATSVNVRGAAMALGVLRFSQTPAAARDRWLPALRSPAVDDAEDYLMWALPFTKEASIPQHPVLRLVIDEAWPDVTAELRIGVIPPMPPWPAGPVTLIGDAIHLAPGFGGNLAMQDAHRLRDALVRGGPGAIGAYEDAMRRDNFPQPVGAV
ncbi:FAD-dependent oxidoreductase [Kibdelosporangium phytohabitans]|uniref:FAD-binding monooxygenase n=1 Tax=Kibdelosporangium phytohabitans TaxID=860235 RepID=A0A0N9I4L3_9PSEU|nr:NAD(P)/FAD-dependent oxidoreductase [Kibdelosporangium phytohabitans]ALG14965.1 FAD-binding monooxygenase [Kibdelosporangium phytohabitans]MBE1469528.1 2-polyprenyl-6-methoxyphenol hydroxylase-like FAD-dependent oxidoreductase [Kibdelosporangium phytohabitans]